MRNQEVGRPEMNEELEIQLPSEIPPALLSRAIDLSHLHVAEVAWLRKDAVEIVKKLQGRNIAILGGDVLRKTDDLFEYDYNNWFIDRKQNESSEAYAVRSLEHAEAYLRKFPDSDDGSVAYVLVFRRENCQPRRCN